MKKIEVVLPFARSTKGTHLYAVKDQDFPVTSIYVKRAAIDGTPPPSIKVTIEVSE